MPVRLLIESAKTLYSIIILFLRKEVAMCTTSISYCAFFGHGTGVNLARFTGVRTRGGGGGGAEPL